MKIMVMTDEPYPNVSPIREGWYFLADSAVSNIGKPFYLPEFMGKTIVGLSCTVRISRLGKSIDPRFAYRYYAEYAPVLHFVLPAYESELKDRGLPLDASRSFDRSLFVGEFMSLSDKSPLYLRINGIEKAEFNFNKFNEKIDNSVSAASRLNT